MTFDLLTSKKRVSRTHHGSQSSTKMAKPRITQTTLYNSPVTSFLRPKRIGKIPTESYPMGAPNRGRVC